MTRRTASRADDRRVGLRPPGWVVAACAAAVMLTACGRASGSAKKLPFVREFGLNDEQFAAHIEKVESVVAKCMAKAGFEYVPVDVQTIEEAQKRVRTEPGYGRIEYKQKWGYGVTTKFDHEARDVGLGPQNLRIFNALSPADQLAYVHTLYGEHPREVFAFAFDEENFTRTGGCTRQGVEAAFTKKEISGDYVNPKDVRFERDRRIIAADKKWKECMHDHGYDSYDDQDEIIDEYAKRLDQLTQGDDPGALTGDRLHALQAMQAEEIKVSLADVDCQIKFTDDIERKVEIEIWGRPVSG